MSRIRTLALATLLAATALLVPATAASAATPLVTTINCDAQTGVITTSIKGNLLVPGPSQPVVVTFQRRYASNVTQAGRSYVPPLATPFKVTVNSTTAGDISATGYTSSFDPATSLYYEETLLVTMTFGPNGAGTTREATCRRDARTTVTFNCDQATGDVDAIVEGRDGRTGDAYNTSGNAYSVRYRTISTYQSGPNDPRFSGPYTSPDQWDIRHPVTLAADGTWADTARIRTVVLSKWYYYSIETTVGVFNSSGQMVGAGLVKCVMVDRSVTPRS